MRVQTAWSWNWLNVSRSRCATQRSLGTSSRALRSMTRNQLPDASSSSRFFVKRSTSTATSPGQEIWPTVTPLNNALSSCLSPARLSSRSGACTGAGASRRERFVGLGLDHQHVCDRRVGRDRQRRRGRRLHDALMATDVNLSQLFAATLTNIIDRHWYMDVPKALLLVYGRSLSARAPRASTWAASRSSTSHLHMFMTNIMGIYDSTSCSIIAGGDGC